MKLPEPAQMKGGMSMDRSVGPLYRFHGSQPPKTGSKHPILMGAPEAAVEDGVARLRLWDPIDSWGGDWGTSAKEFVSVLDSLDDSVEEIRLQINSPGGEVFEGIAIMNALRAHKAKVTAVVDGLAASAASFIAASAGTTLMARNSEAMVHSAWGICIGNAADMQKMSDLLDHLSDNIASVYVAKSGRPLSDWQELMLAETWFSADEAVEAGLADGIDEAADGSEAKNAFDLSVFAHSGRADAPAPPIPSAETPPIPEALPNWQDRRHRMNERRARRAA